jgi:DNA-binding response OmpR family regulator
VQQLFSQTISVFVLISNRKQTTFKRDSNQRLLQCFRPGEVVVQKRVLVVVGDRDTRELLAQTFAGHGFRTLTASDGVSGLFQVGLVQPDLVVLDVNGWDTLRRMRNLSSVPIIVLVKDEPRARIESLNQGADYFVTKPPSLREVEAKARALLREHPSVSAKSVAVDWGAGRGKAGTCEMGA